MKIQYYTVNHFGVDRMYIASEKQATAFYILTKRKIILPEHVEALAALGFTLERVDKPTK